jgi:hypothetical protein
VVDKITPSNTSNMVNRVLNTETQTRTQTNNQGTLNSSSGTSSLSNNTSLNSANTAVNTAANNTNKSIVNVQSVINAIQQLPLNQKLTAQVTSSQALNTNELALLKRTNPDLLQQLKTAQAAQASNPTTANLNSSFLKSNSPLYLTKLAINTTANVNASTDSKILTTITLQAFSANQTLVLGQQNGQLRINANNQPSLNLQDRLQQAASQAIKNILPKQESVSQLQQFTGQLSQTISKLPPNVQIKLASRPVIQALSELNRFTQTSMSLQQGRQVQQALANSGTSFEAKLTQSNHLTNHLTAGLKPNSLNINDTYATVQFNLRASLSTNPQANLHNDIRTNLDKILSAINLSDSTARSNNSLTALNQTDVDKLIAAVTATLSNNTTSAVNHLNAPKNLTAATAALFRLLGIAIPFDAPIVAQLPKAIEQHLKKLIEQTHAKIQFNQLRSIGLDQPASEVRTNLQQFHTELPLRFNEQVLALQLSIHEQEIAKERYRDEAHKETKDDDKNAPIRRWQVFLSFDLPNDEKLHTQLTIIESSISATLWAQSQSLCDKAQKDISWLRDKLLANGLTVEDITCLQGSPPQKGTSLDYNLVDIKT